MLDLLEELLTLALTAAALALLAWLFPARPPVDGPVLTPGRRAAMEKVYGFANVAVLVLGVPCTLLAYRCLRGLARWWVGGSGADHVLVAWWVFWALPALFLGVLLAGLLVEVLLRWRMGEGYRDLYAVMERMMGFDPFLGGLVAGAVCLALALGLSWLWLQLGLALTPTEVRMTWPFSEARTVPLESVQSIHELRPGKYRLGEERVHTSSQRYRVRFGPEPEDYWESNPFHGDWISDAVRGVVEALSARAEVPIEQPEPIEEGRDTPPR